MLGDQLCARHVGFRQDHRKLLATVARDQVGRPPHVAAQHLGHRAQGLVTGLMAMAVVEGLEVIGIDHQ
ncbi:hypothetical protein D3C84_1021030 [compost metagenome]